MTPQHLNRIRLLPDKYLFPEKSSKLELSDENSIGSKNSLNNNREGNQPDITIFGRSVGSTTEKFEQKQRNNSAYNNKLDGSINSFDISLLLQMALMKIPQIPFEYILDVFRWNLFSGNVSVANANEYFWQLAIENQGIHPPGWLNRKNFFDPGAKFHVADNTPFVR